MSLSDVSKIVCGLNDAGIEAPKKKVVAHVDCEFIFDQDTEKEFIGSRSRFVVYLRCDSKESAQEALEYIREQGKLVVELRDE